ncbi:Peptidase S8/S53, subtilisin/kexin/sedolisin [Penicillium expansum]|uniref:Peptidase S8/S53, subtilisin/kexin/sedolisin n=1 Tax=Penicillium expansum TaxID=27334 RepID=A0A0A2JVH4_PENEN|nr:Peptidase S8/S53, subtilisin/kexin/sedolisin [Penicillium expansum]KGO44383.1 Peptidase S8/S53, subtilisin/kexin/sedolisin [Penicillium expansum]KGO58638.1 Peptidase S8/S53, subtilisin/kexin/sedolisin [Penicillium expansum]
MSEENERTQKADDDDVSSSGTESDNTNPGQDSKNKTQKKSVLRALEATLHEIKVKKKLVEKLPLKDLQCLLQKTEDQGEPTALHMLAKMAKDDLPRESHLRPLVDYLVKGLGELLYEKDENAGLTALHYAISRKNRIIVRLICQASDDIDRMLEIPSRNMSKNCIHMAIDKADDKRSTTMARMLVGLASEETLSAKTDDGNTPLHLAIAYNRCTGNRLALVQDIVNRCDSYIISKTDGGDFNNAGQSPYRLLQEQKSKEEERQKNKGGREEDRKEEKEKTKLNKDKRKEGSGRDGYNESTKVFNDAKLLPQENTKPLRRSSTIVGTKIPPKAPAQPEKAIGSQISGVVLDNPAVAGHTPGVMGNDATSQATKTQSGVPVTEVEKILQFLKTHYLRTRDHDAAIEILYGSADMTKDAQKDIYLDLRDKSDLTLKGIKRITSSLKFEDTLQFVDFPQITKTEDFRTTEAPKANMKKRQTNSNYGGRTDMIEVFKLLTGVRRILEVIVDDLKEPAQSDSCIESTLRDKGVEIWNWQKIDMCSEVIRTAAPDVKTLHLYWSGKNAVLRGWSEKDGIPQLKHLRKLILHIQQEVESTLRIKENVNEFERRIKEHIIEARGKILAEEKAEEICSAIYPVIKKKLADKIPENQVDNYIKAVADGLKENLEAKIASAMADLATKTNILGSPEVTPDEEAKNLAKQIASEIAGDINEDTTASMAKFISGEKGSEGFKDISKEIAIKMMERLTKVDVEVVSPQKLAGRSSVVSNSTPVVDEPQKHEWIQIMTDFRACLYNIENSVKPSVSEKIRNESGPIVVALIDDGVDIDREELNLGNGRKIEGCSFCPRLSDIKRRVPYYESSGGHGTIMASQIHRICPWAELYVLKLHDQPDSEQRRITAKSAAQATVKKKVHIISMSWTIAVPSTSSASLTADFQELERAIKEAEKQGILMFCSASDKGAHQGDTYPSKPIKSIFTIGAATAAGRRDAIVGDMTKVDYILPGTLVEGEEIPDSVVKNVKYFTGSSVATALAVGLAALILYCAQIRMMRAKEEKGQYKLESGHFDQLKKHDKMKQAFDNIGTTNDNYLEVWKVFQKSTKDFESQTADAKFARIRDMVATLCTHF